MKITQRQLQRIIREELGRHTVDLGNHPALDIPAFQELSDEYGVADSPEWDGAELLHTTLNEILGSLIDRGIPEEDDVTMIDYFFQSWMQG